LQTDALGANSNTVSAPVTKGVDLGWSTTYSPDEKAYVVNGVDLTAHDASESIPTGSEVEVTLIDTSGAALGEFSSADGGQTWTAPADTVAARDVEGASVVIDGGAVTAAVSDND
jgi:hypothetical protein